MKKITIILFSIFVAAFHYNASCQVSWVQQNSNTSANLWAIQFLDANNGYACGEAGTVVKTADGGTTWTPVNISTANAVNDVCFVSASEGWAVAGDENNSGTTGEIWHTINGGTNWTPQNPSTTEARLGVSMVSSTTGWAVGSKNGPINIDATVNGGTNWTNQTDANIFGWVYKVDALSSTTAFSVGITYFPSVTGFIIKTVNGGTTWTQNNTGTIPFLYGIDMINVDTGFVCGLVGTIMATVNAGGAWVPQTSGTSDTLQDVSFVSASRGWTCGNNGVIRATTDGGANWTGETSGITDILNSIYALDTTTVWAAGTNGRIIKRTLGTGIAEAGINSPATVMVFPNPALSEITFDMASFITGKEPLELRIHTVDGKEIIAQENITGRYFTLSTANLPGGIYFYVVRKGNQDVHTGKLAVQ